MINWKCYRKSEAVAQERSVKMTFCKTSQFSWKSICDRVSIYEAHMSALKWTFSLVFFCKKIKHNFFGSFHSSIRSDMFYRIGLFKNFGKLTGKRFSRSFFLIKLYTIKLATLLKRDSSSDVLLWLFRNYFKHLFYITPPMSVSHFNSNFLTLSLRRT